METWRVVVGLAVVFGLLALLRRMTTGARRHSGSRLPGESSTLRRVLRMGRRGDSTESLRLLRRLSLTSTHQLHVVADDSATLLICTHPHGCSVLRKRAGDSTLLKPERAGGLRKHAS